MPQKSYTDLPAGKLLQKPAELMANILGCQKVGGAGAEDTSPLLFDGRGTNPKLLLYCFSCSVINAPPPSPQLYDWG